MKKFGKILGGIPSGSDRDFEHNQWKTVHIYRRFDDDPDL